MGLVKKLLNEMADITKEGDIVYADNKELKDLKVEDVQDNNGNVKIIDLF